MLVQGESSQLDGRTMDVKSLTGQTLHWEFPVALRDDFLVGGGGSQTIGGPDDKWVCGSPGSGRCFAEPDTKVKKVCWQLRLCLLRDVRDKLVDYCGARNCLTGWSRTKYISPTADTTTTPTNITTTTNTTNFNSTVTTLQLYHLPLQLLTLYYYLTTISTTTTTSNITTMATLASTNITSTTTTVVLLLPLPLLLITMTNTTPASTPTTDFYYLKYH